MDEASTNHKIQIGSSGFVQRRNGERMNVKAQLLSLLSVGKDEWVGDDSSERQEITQEQEQTSEVRSSIPHASTMNCLVHWTAEDG